MVNVSTKVSTPGQRAKERVAKVHRLRTRPGIRVEPANDDMRRLLVHPRAGHFRSEGSMEWPDDTFTHRRLRDGDIKRVETKKNNEHVAAIKDEPQADAVQDENQTA
jgi:hypothetical protein